jgi:hypothetical protein
MKENNENTQAYPGRSSSDEQFKSQDEFASQKPNEKASNNSDLPQPAIKEADTSAPGDKTFRDTARERES